MDQEHDLYESRADAALAVDRTISYFLLGIGVVLGFLLILSTFVQVNRVTAKPAQDDDTPIRVRAPEIGG